MGDLSESKQRLLERRLGARPSAAPRPEERIPPRAEGPAPLSAGQSALLYEYRLRPDEAVYNIVHAYRICGPLDADRLEHAILAAVGRHEPLRTSFGTDRVRLERSEAAHVVETAMNADEFARLAAREAHRHFDLEAGPLVRATLTRLGDEEHGLVLALHHVSSDAASLAILWRDIDRAYRGEHIDQPERSYSDHAEWQAARIDASDRDFWADHLGSDPQPVVLPLPTPGPGASDGYLTRSLPVEPAALRSTGQRPMPLFLSVFAALLQRYTDTDDVVVGVTASTRDHPAVEALVGYFLTILPLRLSVDPHATPAQLSGSVDATLAGALPHRRVPYAEIAAGLRRRGAAHPDPARVMFVLDEPHEPEISGCRVEGRLVHPGASVADLTLFVRPAGSGYEISVEWDGGRYRSADMEALADEYARMADWAVRHPGSSWSAMPAASDVEGPELTAALCPVPTLIAGQGEETPDAPALRCADERLDYAGLAARSAATSRALAERGVRSGDRVGVLLPRSVDLVATILGIQQLGAAYVPMDPSYPDSRLAMLGRVGSPRLTVTDRTGASRLDGPVVTLDDLDDSGHVAPGDAPTPRLDDPAYVIFTSGSTRRPRGVPVDQRRLAASTLARLDHYPEPVDRFLMVSSVGFDSSVAGLYWTLTHGGELVLPTDDEVHDIDALGELIATAAVSHTLMVPTLYRALLGRDPTLLTSLRRVVVAGETCPASLVEDHYRLLPDTALSNEYGPTETTVWATAHECRSGEDPVPIGSPVPGVTVRVADRWLRPRPPGAAGDLAIGGAGVTDGYLGEPELDAAAFVTDQRTGQRFYRSGDLVRTDEAGRLQFLGRRDHQLSIGGTRLEPEEIEAALTDQDGVRAAVARVERELDDDALAALATLSVERAGEVLRAAGVAADPVTELAEQLARHGPGSDVLVAYVEGDHLDPSDLSSQLRDALPRAMVPSAIEVIDQLPRTEHGKVDRGALPPPLRQRSPEAPQEDSAGVLDDLVDGWNRVLDTTDLGPDSDFFASGGDSLLAVQLVTLLEDRLGRRVPISALVLGRTPRQLAALVATPTVDIPATERFRRSYVVPLRPYGERPPLVILPPGGGNLVVFDPLVQAFDEQFPVIGFDLPGADRDEELPSSVEALCDTYLPQLRAAQPTGPYRFLGWSFGGVVALELAQRLRAEGEEVELIGMIDTVVPGLQRARRARAYLELLRDGDLGGIVSKLRQTVRVRIMLWSAARKGRRAAARGEALEPVDRNTWLTIKVDEFVERYRPRPYAGHVVFFAAQDTYSWRTTEPWRQLIPGLEIVTMEGTHEGTVGLLSGPRAARIAAEMAKRMT